MSRRSRAVFLAGLGAIALVTAACSSSKGSSSNSNSSTAAATGATGAGASSGSSGGGQQATGSAIKIGFLLAQTGSFASSTGPGLPAAKAWASWVNDNGGIAGGHQVQIVAGDSKGDATAGAAAAKQLIEVDKVDAIIVGDPVAEYAVQPYLQKVEIAKLSASGYAPFWHQVPEFFGTSDDSNTAQGAAVPPAVNQGLKTLAVAVCAEVASCEQGALGYTLPLGVKLGMKSAGVVKVSSSSTDYTPQCLALKQKNVDYLYFSVPPAAAARMMANCLAQGYSGYFGGSATGFDAKVFGSVKGAKILGGINGFPWWVHDAPVQKYLDAMAKYQPSAEIGTAMATATWTSLELLRKAMTQTTGAVSRQTILDALYTVKDETLDGLLAQPVTYTKGAPAPLVTCSWPFKMNGGDKDPSSTPISGKSGNGQTGDLATQCLTSS